MTITTADSPRYRIASIDILRGVVMIIMALDHTRDFFHAPAMVSNPLNPDTTTIWIFFTRWITHFCAPTFVFLSGLSAYLSSRKKTTAEASSFLIKRGLWLIIVEVVIVTLGLTFNPLYNFIILQVIWAIGFSMILLGLLSRISFKLVFVTGLILFFGHNLVDYVTPPENRVAATLLQAFLSSPGAVLPLDSSHFIGIFYAVLPWTGVMLLGYCAGRYFVRDFPAEKRRRLLLFTGLALITLFIVLRVVNAYGDPVPRREETGFLKNLFAFLDASKYPPSLQYLAMTLGPALVLLSLFENIRGKWTQVVSIYGRVPFFYYILHFYILHLTLVAIFFITGHGVSEIVAPGSPFLFRPNTFGFTLPVVYLIWISVVAVLYRPCRWFDKYKKEHSQWWLKYL